VQAVTTALPDAHLEGLAHRLKDADSLRRKVAADLIDDPSRSVDDVLARVKDSVRYTICAPEAAYADTVNGAVQGLRDRGFVLVPKAWKDFWGKPGYQGINSTWRDPASGQLFEVQFHTPASFEVKTITHPVYQRLRLPGLDPALEAELRAQHDAAYETIPRAPRVDLPREPGE
jgi:hypothetical protein